MALLRVVEDYGYKSKKTDYHSGEQHSALLNAENLLCTSSGL